MSSICRTVLDRGILSSYSDWDLDRIISFVVLQDMNESDAVVAASGDVANPDHLRSQDRATASDFQPHTLDAQYTRPRSTYAEQ